MSYGPWGTWFGDDEEFKQIKDVYGYMHGDECIVCVFLFKHKKYNMYAYKNIEI